MTDRLALFVPTLSGGGAERVMLALANRIAERGIPVDLVLAKAAGPYLADVRSDVHVVDLAASRVLRSLPALVRYLRRRRPRAMLTALGHANIVALWARRLAGVPTRLVISEHNSLRAPRGGRGSRRRSVPWWLMRRVYPGAEAIVAVSHGVAADLAAVIGLPVERIHVVYNPVAIADLEARFDEPFTHPWFQAGSPPVILSVGRLTEQKDYATLVAAFAIARAQRACRLVILGEGEDRGDLSALVERSGLAANVLLPGFVNNPVAWLRRAALFVMSSRWEGMPLVLLEAMACGAPVVCTDCPHGPAEILENGRWGRLVPVGDPSALATAILAALADPQHPDVAGRAAAFSVDRTVDGYLELLGQRHA